MSYLPIASDIANHASGAKSALPDAPVIPDREPAPARPRLATPRIVLGRTLRRMASTIEPTPTYQSQ